MSGEKRTFVSVDQSYLRNLQEKESRLRMVVNDLPEQLNNVRNQVRSDMQGQISAVNARAARSEQMVNGLQSELRNVEWETQRRFQQQQAQFEGELRQQERAFDDKLARQRAEVGRALMQQRNEYLGMFIDQDRKFTGMVTEERRQRQQAVNNLQQQITSIVNDAQRKQNANALFVADVTKILQDTDSLPHKRFAPGKWERISRDVSHAQTMVNQGHDALGTAYKAYEDIADLRVEVLLKEREFMLAYQAAMQEARTLLEEARANRKNKLEFGSGADREEVDLEVDFWTREELSEHEEKIRTIKKRLKDGEQTLTIEEVKAILKELEELGPKLPEIVERAKQNIIASQLRVNIAHMAIEALGVKGFQVQDSVYEGDDMRNAYVVKVKNIGGDEVVTVISPVEGEIGKNEVSIHSFDQTYISHEALHQRADDLARALIEKGLLAEQPISTGHADSEMKDIEAVRSRKRSKKTELRTRGR